MDGITDLYSGTWMGVFDGDTVAFAKDPYDSLMHIYNTDVCSFEDEVSIVKHLTDTLHDLISDAAAIITYTDLQDFVVLGNGYRDLFILYRWTGKSMDKAVLKYRL